MARSPERNDPLGAVRRLLRDVRKPVRLSANPLVMYLFPKVPAAELQATVANAVLLALYRLPRRQRELLKRHDLESEPAAKVQKTLGLSARQFYRDRHAALTALSAQLLGPMEEPLQVVATPEQRTKRNQRSPRGKRNQITTPAPQAVQRSASRAIVVDEPELLRRTLARNLSQLNDIDSLRVLRELAIHGQDPSKRADLLLDLADEATEYDDDAMAYEAMRAVARILQAERETENFDYLSGRLARAQGRLADTRGEVVSLYTRAAVLLRRAIAEGTAGANARAALADTLGDLALTNFADGAFAEARTASFEARRIIEVFDLWSRPRATDIIAMDAVLEACVSGKIGQAITVVSSLLGRSIESGWFSTAHKLGANLVGLHAVRSDYDEAIRWYQRLASSPVSCARPRDRIHLTLEAAHAFTMSGRPAEALRILGYDKPGDGCPSAESPAWHAFASFALERSGDGVAALAEAHQSLEGYASQQVARGIGDAHRLIAMAQDKLGNARAATEHILEAQRLTEIYGTPYAILRTLVARANILESTPLKMEALEFARLLLRLGKDPDDPPAHQGKTVRQ